MAESYWWISNVIISILLQGFIQVLLLTSVFHEGLSFMAVGHNPACASMLSLAAGDSRGQCKPPLWGSGAKSLEDLIISAIPGFQIAFPWIIHSPDLFPLRSLFACVRLAWRLHLPPPHTKWQHKMAVHVKMQILF